MMNQNQELIKKAKEAKSPEELQSLAKENNMELTEEEATAYFAQLHGKTGELSDDELDNVAGGGCHTGDGRMITTIIHVCEHFKCEKCGWTGTEILRLGTDEVNVCKHCGAAASCNFCALCSYEKGLWLCNSPNNRK
ncbi:MAG: hypothetical protein ACI4A3_10175 [Lachnospiraceae bacterium]